jgi:hypothetical protein
MMRPPEQRGPTRRPVGPLPPSGQQAQHGHREVQNQQVEELEKEPRPRPYAGQRRQGPTERSSERDDLEPQGPPSKVQEPIEASGSQPEATPSASERLAATYEAIEAIKGVGELGSISPDRVQQLDLLSDEVTVRSRHAETLESARQEVLHALESEESDRMEGDWTSQLLPAANQLLEGLDRFLADDALWSRLRGAEAATAVLDERSELVVREIFEQDLGAMLQLVGYREPPPAQQLEAELKTSLAEALRGPSALAMRAERTRRAEQNMAIFTNRLRRVITEAELEGRNRGVGHAREGASVRARLHVAMGKGAELAGPATLAAGAVGLVFPPAGGAAGLGAAAVASGRELLRQSVEVAATGLLNKVAAGEAAAADVSERFAGATRRIQGALSDYVASLDRLAKDPTPLKANLARSLTIESLSSVYGLLQAQVDVAQTRHYALHVATRAVLAQLREGQRLIETANHRDEISQLAERLELERIRLRDVIATI